MIKSERKLFEAASYQLVWRWARGREVLKLVLSSLVHCRAYKSLTIQNDKVSCLPVQKCLGLGQVWEMALCFLTSRPWNYWQEDIQTIFKIPKISYFTNSLAYAWIVQDTETISSLHAFLYGFSRACLCSSTTDCKFPQHKNYLCYFSGQEYKPVPLGHICLIL